MVEEVDDLAVAHCLRGPEGTSRAGQGHKGAELSASLGTGQAVGAPRKDVCLRETLCGLSWPGRGAGRGAVGRRSGGASGVQSWCGGLCEGREPSAWGARC